MKLILFFSSMAVIIFSGIYLYQENISSEWKAYQAAYLDLIDQNQKNDDPGSHSPSFSFTTGLKQIWLPEMNRADRCISCHVAIENPDFKDHNNPLKTHPEDYLKKHDRGKYGCSICHDGQGRVVNFREAAADDPDVFWNKPLLRKPFIEANCYRCHVDLLKQTPWYNQGKQKFETSGCLGCHKREGKGGFAGPELMGIGNASIHVKYPTKTFDPELLSRLNRNKNIAYIYEAVRSPKAQPEQTAMFDYKLSRDDTFALIVYLKSLSKHEPGTRKLPFKPVSPLKITQRGKKSFELYCTACHGKNAKGGVKNPNYANDYIPKLNTLSEQMSLYQKSEQDVVIALLDESGDLLNAGPRPEIPGFFKTIAKYMSVKNTILRGRVVEKKDDKGPAPLNMPAWENTLSEKEILSIISYLILIY